MIDIENQVFNYVANALRAEYGNSISIYGEYVEVPEQFPSVTLVEDDNASIPSVMTLTRSPERAASLMYTANVYSNLQSGKKAQAKEILDLLDSKMIELGFTRSMRTQLPNVDRTIYRVTARYTKIHQIFQ